MSKAASSKKVLIAGRCSETIYRQRRALAMTVREAGWEVHLCGDAGPARYRDLLAADGFVFHSLPLDQKSKNPLNALRLAMAYYRIVRELRPAIFHAFNFKPTIIGLPSAAVAGARTRIATVAGLGHAFMAHSALVRRIARLAFKFSLAFANTAIFYNGEDEALFISNRLVSRQKALRIPGSGIDLNRFNPTPLPPGEILEILFIGRLLREKGILELLEAAEELHRRGSAVRITILGDADHHNPSSISSEDIEAAASRGLVAWHGSVENVVPYIAQSHVVVLPSYREGIPLALLEAGAMGRALIATDTAGCRDVVTPHTGLRIPVGDAQALIEAIEALSANRPHVEALGHAASEHVRATFASAVVNRQVANVYGRLVGA